MTGKFSLRLKALWLKDNWESLSEPLGLPEALTQSPSKSTLQRVLKYVDAPALQECVSETIRASLWLKLSPGLPFHYALDGKSRRGVRSPKTQRTEIDLNLFEVTTYSPVAKRVLPDKEGESSGAQIMLQNLRKFPEKIPTGIVTFDGALTTPRVTKTLAEVQLGYLGGLKRFNGTVYEEIAAYPWGSVEVAARQGPENQHGRQELREIKTLKIQNLPPHMQAEFQKYPQAALILQVFRRRKSLKTQKVSEETAYFLGSRELLLLSADQILEIQRKHWTIENSNHHVRDTTLQEDSCPTKKPQASQALGA